MYLSCIYIDPLWFVCVFVMYIDPRWLYVCTKTVTKCIYHNSREDVMLSRLLNALTYFFVFQYKTNLSFYLIGMFHNSKIINCYILLNTERNLSLALARTIRLD